MADFLFVPQTVLDRWSEQGKVHIDGYVLTLLGENKVFTLTAAVRFLKMEAGEDLSGLLQKVKTVDALKQMGAEHFEETVILGDSAYEVQQGFLADASAIRRAAAAAAGKESSAGKISGAASGIVSATASSAGVPLPAAPATPAAANPAAATPAAANSAAPATPATPAAAGKPAPAKAAEGSEPDLLAQFFLENLQ